MSIIDKINEKIELIVAKLSNETPEKVETNENVVEEVKFEDIKAGDGTILRVSAIEVDATIEIIGEDGTLTPATGEYILEDGSTIVAENGKIIEIKPMEQTPVIEETKEIKQEFNAEERIVNLELNLQKVLDSLTILMEKIELNKVDEIKQELSKVSNRVEEIAKLPATNPISKESKIEKNEKVKWFTNLK